MTPWIYSMTDGKGTSPSESEQVANTIAGLVAWYQTQPGYCGHSEVDQTGAWIDGTTNNEIVTSQRRQGYWLYTAMVLDSEGRCLQSTRLFLAVNRSRSIHCPDPNASLYWNTAVLPHTTCIRIRANCSETKPLCPRVGNPVSVLDGLKWQTEIDYVGAGSNPLRFERTYVHGGFAPPPGSSNDPGHPLGYFWRHTYQRSVALYVYSSATIAVVARPDGFPETFTKVGTSFQSTRHVGPLPTLSQQVNGSGQTTGWIYVAPDDTIEAFDADGRLASTSTRSGQIQALAYDANGRLQSVSDAFGRRLSLSYDANGRVQTVTDPAGGNYVFGFEDRANNLVQAAYPDSRTRVYSYGEAAYVGTTLPNALTGITDENAQRFAIFRYSSAGVATSTSYLSSAGVEVDKYSVNAGSHAVTGPLGLTRTFGAQTVAGVNRLSSLTQPCASPGCTEIQTYNVTYDSNGNVDSRTDFNGKKSCHAFDLARNLETARIEGALSSENCSTVLATLPNRPDVRRVSTQWHAIWRLPVKVAEPNRIATSVYNGDGGVYCAPTTALVAGNPIGVLCRKTLQETTDATGQQGLVATVTGTPRVWRYTYDSYGQLLTATDPNDKTTTTTYYAADDPDLGKRGNVQTVTNPLGHVTTFTAYDLNGRPTAITDPNGTVTTLAYHPRGWLTSRTVGGETTRHDYDGVGQLTKVTLPDGSYVQYTYDGAHRLTQMQDGLGNKIVYTLDAMGNRIKEQAFDPSGALARVRQQVYDSLNRLHQTVGAQ